QREPARGRAHEESGQDRLTDVSGIQEASQVETAESAPGDRQDHRLIPPHQFLGRLSVPDAHPVDEMVKRIIVPHGETPRIQRRRSNERHQNYWRVALRVPLERPSSTAKVRSTKPSEENNVAKAKRGQVI